MTNRDYSKYEAALKAEKVRLEAALEKVAFLDSENPTDWVPKRESMNVADGEAVEANELAEEIQEYEINTATVKELEYYLNEVIAALDRLEKDTYGIDEVSGEEIPLDRLDAYPAARTITENAPEVEIEATTQNEID